MKKQNVFMALFLAAFMLLFFGSVSSADPNMAPPGTVQPGQVDISHCANMPPTTRPACEAQAHGGPPNMAPPGGPHGDPCMAVPAGPDRAACYATQPGPGHHAPNMAPPNLVGVGPSAPVAPPMYGGPNDHHIEAPVGLDGGHD